MLAAPTLAEGGLPRQRTEKPKSHDSPGGNHVPTVRSDSDHAHARADLMYVDQNREVLWVMDELTPVIAHDIGSSVVSHSEIVRLLERIFADPLFSVTCSSLCRRDFTKISSRKQIPQGARDFRLWLTIVGPTGSCSDTICCNGSQMEINRASTLAKVLARDRALEAQSRKDEDIKNRGLSDQVAFPGSIRFPEAVEATVAYLSDLAEIKVSSIQDAYAQTGTPLTGQTVTDAMEALRLTLETVVSAKLAAWREVLDLLRARSGEPVAASEVAFNEAKRQLGHQASKLCEKAEAKLDVLLQSSLAAAENAEKRNADEKGAPLPPRSDQRLDPAARKWSRSDKLTAIGVLVAIVGLTVPFLGPIGRRLHLDGGAEQSFVSRASSAAAPPKSPAPLPSVSTAENKTVALPSNVPIEGTTGASPDAPSTQATGNITPESSGPTAAVRAVISPGAASLQLPLGRLYLYGMATGGAAPSSSFAVGQCARAVNATGQLTAALSYSTVQENSYATSTGFHVIGGASVNGSWDNVHAFYGSNEASGASYAAAGFTVDKDSLVVVIGLAGGQQSVSLRSNFALETDALNSGPSAGEAMVIAHGYVKPGRYTVAEQSAALSAGQDADHMADLIGVFVFSSGDSGH